MLTMRSSRLRRGAASLAVAAATTLAVGVLSTPAAHADDSSTLTVVGTSDVYDSYLMQTVIIPDFEAAYPQYTLNYVSKGTGAAISYAEAGTASALLVHAPTLETGFVSGGYALNDVGRAIFYGDYVLLGPADDPAHVMTDAPHNIVDAFQDVAAAGAAGNATFVSRGSNPGTTIQEHQIWADTTGVQTCNVTTANGGGAEPTTLTAGSSCGDTLDQNYPDWYKATGLTQGPNIENADACNYPNGGCYVFTDRGTYNYLVSTHAISNLGIATNNSMTDTPAAQIPLLINSFHAYAVDPAAFAGNPNVQINETAAVDFLNWIQTPKAQTAIEGYLSDAQGGSPFRPDAAPKLTVTTLPSTTKAGKPLLVHGKLSNVVPGTLPLSGVKVTVDAAPVGHPGQATPVATATTGASGSFTARLRPSAARTYTVSTSQITESPYDLGLDYPTYNDVLAPASATAGTVKVVAAPTLTKISSPAHRKLTVHGALRPAAANGKAVIRLFAAQGKGALKFVGKRSLAAGAKTYTETFVRPAGTYRIQLRYADPGAFEMGSTLIQRALVH